MKNNEKYYLGISLGFNASASLMSSSRGLLGAISEERLNGEKNTKQFPFKAINKLADGRMIDCLAVCFYESLTFESVCKYLPEHVKLSYDLDELWDDCKHRIDFFIKRLIFMIAHISCNNVIRVNHHLAHALSTPCIYGFPLNSRKSLYITSDGFGDGLSAKIVTSFGDEVSSIPMHNSIALIYQFVTGALGFKEHQHEGKITGLAAFGQPIFEDAFKHLFDNRMYGYRITNVKDSFTADILIRKDWSKSPIENFDLFMRFKETVYKIVEDLQTHYNATREDIAASVQKFAEVETANWIIKSIKRYYGQNKYLDEPNDFDIDLYLAGGLFANVKLNQRIHAISFVENVFVSPCMGDEGTAIGAAYVAMRDYIGLNNMPTFGLHTGHNLVYLGDNATVDEYDDCYKMSDDIASLLTLLKVRDNYAVTVQDDGDELTTSISDFLADNKIVCLFRGKMEYGPRALCNRSILYNCNTKETNDWLNKRLNRTEFMPFAPVTRDEDAYDLFSSVDLKGAMCSAEFMTITMDGTKEFKANYPAACHIDGTARPQILFKEDNPFMYDVLTKYKEKTGLKALINTSFNLHNNPIIEGIETAVESFVKAELDVLVIGSVVIHKIK